jgi:hypothetical protein
MIVTDADGDPWTRSGKGTIVISRSIGTIAGGVAREAVAEAVGCGEDVAVGSPACRAYAATPIAAVAITIARTRFERGHSSFTASPGRRGAASGTADSAPR